MRRSISLVCVALALVAFGSAGCKKKQAPITNKVAPVAQQATKPPQPVALPNVHALTELQNEKTAYLTSARGQLDDMNKRIAPMQVTTAKTFGASRVEYTKLLTDVNAKRAAFQVDLVSVQNATQANWQQVRAKADADLTALRSSMAAAQAKIPSAPKRTASR